MLNENIFEKMKSELDINDVKKLFINISKDN